MKCRITFLKTFVLIKILFKHTNADNYLAYLQSYACLSVVGSWGLNKSSRCIPFIERKFGKKPIRCSRINPHEM